jgi:hypothetical protein
MQEVNLFQVFMFVVGSLLGLIQLFFFATINDIKKSIIDEKERRRKQGDMLLECRESCERKRSELKKEILSHYGSN